MTAEARRAPSGAPPAGAPPAPAAVRRLVAVQLYFLGDTLLATPALRALRRRFPEAELEVVVKRRSAAALARNPHLDRLTLYDPPSLWQRPFHWAALGRRWRTGGVDLAVDFTGDRRSARLLRSMRASRSVGFAGAGRASEAQATLPKACGTEHVARHMLDLVALAGASGDATLEYHVADAARAEARAWRARGPHGAPVVALHPGCNRELRRWKLDRFARLAQALAARGVRVWVTGGREEAGLGASLASHGAEPLAGRLDLDRAAAYLEASDLLVANDSGPMHLAAAVGTPVLSLFGPSEPHTAAPQGPAHAFLHHRQPCCPCDQRRCVLPADFCMDRISVAQVLAAAERMLAAGRPGGPGGAGPGAQDRGARAGGAAPPAGEAR